MGFFSSIFRAIKDIFAAVMRALSSFLTKVFGSPIVAALAIFIITWMVTGFPGWEAFLADPLFYLTASPILAAAAVNLFFEVVFLIAPDFRAIFAKIMGFIGFVLFALGVWHFIAEGQLFMTAEWLTNQIGSFGLTEAQFAFWFKATVTFSYMNFVSGMSAGPDGEYVQAYVDGFFAVPGVVAELGDAVIEGVIGAATSSLAGLVLAGAGLYMGYKWLTADPKPSQQQVTSQPALQQQPGLPLREEAYGS